MIVGLSNAPTLVNVPALPRIAMSFPRLSRSNFRGGINSGHALVVDTFGNSRRVSNTSGP